MIKHLILLGIQNMIDINMVLLQWFPALLIKCLLLLMGRSSHPEVFLRKGVLKICSTFTGEYPCRTGISIKLQSNFIEIAFRDGYSPVNLSLIFRTLFSRNTSGWLLLNGVFKSEVMQINY